MPSSLGKSIIGCSWVFTIKVDPNGQIDHVAKGYAQIFGLSCE